MLPLKDTHRIPKFPFWTITLILVNVFIFYLELSSVNPVIFITKYALIPSFVSIENIYSLFPFITSQFLHGGFLHIISNMLFLWVFGNNVEADFGFLVFPFFYLLSGVVAGFAQYISAPTDTIPMIGASGAVSGVLGAYLARFPSNKIKTLVFIFVFITVIDIPAYLLLFYWFITQLFSSVASITLSSEVGGIAFLSHVGGFLFGYLVATFTLHNPNNLKLKFS